MPDLKATTIYSMLPSVTSVTNNSSDENNNISYWLEKLHIQGEEIRKDNNRREEHAKNSFVTPKIHKQPTNKVPFTHAISGIKEHAKNAATKREQDKQAVHDLVRKSNRRIITISSTFPWDVFPSVIDVEESRVTFKFNQFLTSQTHSVDIRDISNVFIETSLFFSTLQVVSRTFIQNDIKISNLNKSDARKVQRIIEGLRTFKEHNINTSNYEIDELISKIEEFHTYKQVS